MHKFSDQINFKLKTNLKEALFKFKKNSYEEGSLLWGTIPAFSGEKRQKNQKIRANSNPTNRAPYGINLMEYASSEE